MISSFYTRVSVWTYSLIILAPLAPLNHLTVSTNNFVGYSQYTDDSESDSYRFASGLLSPKKQYSSYLLRLSTVSLYLPFPRFPSVLSSSSLGCVILLFSPPLSSVPLSPHTLLYNPTCWYFILYLFLLQEFSTTIQVLHCFGIFQYYRPAFFHNFFFCISNILTVQPTSNIFRLSIF